MKCRIFTLAVLTVLTPRIALAQTHYVIVRDLTESYSLVYLKLGDELMMRELLPQLSPGDRITILNLGSFSLDLVKVDKICPSPNPELWQKDYESFSEWKRSQHLLLQIWEQTEKIKAECIAWLEQNQVQRAGGTTQLHTLLAFISVLMANSSYEHQSLFLYSDLQTTGDGRTTFLAPRELITFSQNLEVKFLFIPWAATNWTKMKSSWSHFWSSVASFSMLDPISSKLATDLTTQSGIPRTLPPFKPSKD